MSTAPLDLPAADDDEGTETWVRERADAALDRARGLVDRIRDGGAGAPPLDVLRLWDQVELEIGNVAAVGSLYANVHPAEPVRAAAEHTEQEAMRLSTELGLDRALFDVVAGLDADDPALDDDARRLLTKLRDDFRRSGVDRDDATRGRITAIRERITELDQQFSKLTRDDVRTVRVAPDRLDGLPDDWREAHPADDDGLVTVTTDYPDAIPVRMFAHDADLRRELGIAFLERGWPEAEELLRELFALRHELATTVGFADWPSYDADVKMIGGGDATVPEEARDEPSRRIPEFVDRIAAAAEEPMRRDLDVLLERYRRDVPDVERVPGYDLAYYSELVRQERYEVDSQQVRRYFAFEKVRQGLLDVTGRLFGLTYQAVDVPTWHDDVASYDVHRDDDYLGRIHLDLHPREGKYKHAAQFTLTDGVAGRQQPEGVLVCNFSRGLMEHDHVVTLFHEFGHLLHHVLAGHGQWARFAGVATEWDFVEAPSQMLEEWAWDAAVLATFATDEAGEPIPAALVERMRRGDDFGKGVFARTQMFYAAISYWFHADQARPTEDGGPPGLTDRMIELQERYAPTAYVPGTHFYAAFGHLGGYSSGYYTYMWSLVIAKDMFSAFADGDLLGADSLAAAERYRDAVLVPGGRGDAADLVADFLGRPYAFDAYATWLSR